MPNNAKAGAGNTGQERDLRQAANLSHAHCTASGGNGQVYAQGHVVGQVRGDTFYKTVRRSVHLYRVLPGWAVDVQSLADVEGMGARWVQYFDEENKVRYRASITDIRRYGVPLNYKGYGRQLALHLDRWQVTRPGQEQAEQLSLFGGTL